ncbi:hypothetical protein [Nitrosovibrio tenuis]|uniref:hypothetical protein n=1 Tax=Nitrosovibrio tenuis TaxID=1233 RepID=UPI0011600745|nr:hypothetical protein [Nitrosovibrio tenuis]
MSIDAPDDREKWIEESVRSLRRPLHLKHAALTLFRLVRLDLGWRTANHAVHRNLPFIFPSISVGIPAQDMMTG